MQHVLSQANSLRIKRRHAACLGDVALRGVGEHQQLRRVEPPQLEVQPSTLRPSHPNTPVSQDLANPRMTYLEVLQNAQHALAFLADTQIARPQPEHSDNSVHSRGIGCNWLTSLTRSDCECECISDSFGALLPAAIGAEDCRPEPAGSDNASRAGDMHRDFIARKTPVTIATNQHLSTNQRQCKQ